MKKSFEYQAKAEGSRSSPLLLHPDSPGDTHTAAALTNLPWEENLLSPAQEAITHLLWSSSGLGLNSFILSEALKKNGQITSCPHQSVILGFHVYQMQTLKTSVPVEFPTEVIL